MSLNGAIKQAVNNRVKSFLMDNQYFFAVVTFVIIIPTKPGGNRT